MSRLDELIQKLCPNGVEYKRIDEICIVQNGYTPSKKNNDFWEDGDIPWFRMEDIRQNGRELENAIQHITSLGVRGSVFPANSLIFATTATVGEHALIKVPFVCNQQLTHIHINDEYSNAIEIRYLFHYAFKIDEMCKNNTKGGSTLPAVDLNKFKSFKIAIPPLEVQREIVRILDYFTLLTAELTAELTARKKQYEFYRDELLKGDSQIPMITLGEIATDIYRGSGIKRDEVTEDGIPCVRYGEIYTQYNTWFDKCASHTQLECISNPKYFEHGDILFAITGESVEDIAKSIAYIGHDKCLAGGDIVVMKHEQNPRYLAHVLNTSMSREQKRKGKVKSKVVHSNVSSIAQIIIPLPSLDVQKRYADVLDNFEQICNDLKIGLPAEIEARQKQYEYYRDLLLTFAETGNTILTDRQTDRQTVIKLIQYVFGYAPVKLGEIATIIRGGNFQKKDFVENGRPCIHYGQMYTHFGIYADKTLTYLNDEVFAKSKIAKPGDIIMAVTSENVEDVCSCTAWLGNEEIAVSGHTAIISHNQNAKYLSYYFHSAMFYKQKKKLAHGTKVIEVTPSKLADTEIMLPTLEEQERIVSILDRFDSLCNDLTSGLPAEIEARQKQYEYYRDKLLSFK